LRKKLGDIVYVEVETIETVGSRSIFGTVEAVKTVSDLFIPVAGTITNSMLHWPTRQSL